MKKFANRLVTACLSATITIGSIAAPVLASNLENESAVAGIAISLNNYYATSYTPEADILDYLTPLAETETQTEVQMQTEIQSESESEIQAGTEGALESSSSQAIPGTSTVTGAISVAAAAQYSGGLIDLIPDDAQARESGIVSVLGKLNVRKEPSSDASSQVVGYLYSNSPVEIYSTVTVDDENWYLVSSDGIEGYVRADFVRTGKDALIAETDMTNKVATVLTDGLEARNAANDDAEVVEILHADERYAVQEIQGGYAKLVTAGYAVGYASISGLKIETELPDAVAVADSASAEQLQEYKKDLDYGETEYRRRLADGDYSGALSAVTWMVEVWGYYIDEASYAGLTELKESAEKEREKAIIWQAEAQELVNSHPVAVPETTVPPAPETVPAMPETEAPMPETTVAPVPETAVPEPETIPAATETEAPIVPETEPPTEAPTTTTVPAPVITGITACYRGGQKYEGQYIESQELYVVAAYSDGNYVDITEGWTCNEVGMTLSAGNHVITMYYDNYSSVFEIWVEPAPTEAPTEAPVPEPVPEPTPAPTEAVVIPDRDYRAEIVNYAVSWVGRCSYVWAGANLTDGGAVDCSGFTMCVFRNVAGISLPHYSYAQMDCGGAIGYEQLRPGDLVFYERHVAIYIGGGQIVHAKSPQAGIVVDSVFFSETQLPIGYRSLLP